MQYKIVYYPIFTAVSKYVEEFFVLDRAPVATSEEATRMAEEMADLQTMMSFTYTGRNAKLVEQEEHYISPPGYIDRVAFLPVFVLQEKHVDDAEAPEGFKEKVLREKAEYEQIVAEAEAAIAEAAAAQSEADAS